MAVKSICVQAVLAYTALLLCCGLADAAFGKDNVQALHSWFNNQSSLFEPTVISKVLGGVGPKKGKLIGKDKLKGKFGGKGLLLSGALAGGQFGQGAGLGASSTSAASGTSVLSSLIDGRVDEAFGGLLSASPFQFNPAAKKKGLFSKKPLGKKKGLKHKNVKAGLPSKLQVLNQALGMGQQAPSVLGQSISAAGDALDRTIGAAETASRLGFEGGLALLDANPETANMKNLIFQTMLFGLFVDSGLNARKSVLSSSMKSVKGYKDIFRPLGTDFIFDPILGAFEQSIDTIEGIRSIPQSIFRASGTEDEESLGTLATGLRNMRDRWESTTGDLTEFRQRGYRALSRILGRAERSPVTSTTDDGIDWFQGFRSSTQNQIDSAILDAERALNDLVNIPNNAINEGLNTILMPTIDDIFDGNLRLADPRDTLRRLRSTSNTQIDDVREVLGSGLDVFRGGQEASRNAIESVLRDAIDGPGLSSLRAPDGSLLSSAFDPALSLSQDARTRLLDIVEGAASNLDSIVASAAEGVGDSEIASLISQSTNRLDTQALIDALDVLPIPDLP